MLFYISVALILILIIFISIKIIFLGSILLKIKVTYVKYKHLSSYANIVHFIIGFGFIITAYNIFKAIKAIDFPYDIVSSMLFWAGIIHIYNSLKMGTTMFVRNKGLHHGVMVIKWKDIRECRFHKEYFVMEQKNGKISRFEIEQYKADDFRKILSSKITLKL